MAKLSVLYLPATKNGELEEAPFALVLSDVDTDDVADLGEAVTAFKDKCGARAMLVTHFPIQVD